MQDYNSTLNLTSTDFPMRAGLPQREPGMLEEWEGKKLYNKMLEKNKNKPLYVLHDGPPFANGDIHLGTALNKILKDFIVKYKGMRGYQSPYVPGWDTHGLPIELKAMRKLSSDKGVLSPLEIRKACKDFALLYMGNQMEQFKRLGVFGDFEHPYLTLNPAFEAKEIRVFGEMAKKGYIYRGLKPVYWCPECETALAEAEIEYDDQQCDSIYVKFAVKSEGGKLAALGADLSKTYFVIWTTTTWTLPGNVAICVGPQYFYALVKAGEEYYIMAKDLVESAMAAAKTSEYEILGEIEGQELEYMVCSHPFIERDSLVIVGSHVTLESGTGCVHTAPGHGVEDFEVCRNYENIPIIVPVDSKGKMTAQSGGFEGLTTTQANKAILNKLKETGALFAVENINHPYPHCWRCDSPILFRATEQWFCSIDGFKEEAIEAVQSVQWIPGWGEERMTGMIRDRSDWCISRQRVWGVPFPIFFCEDCEKEIITDETIEQIATIFEKEGSDAWFKYEADKLLPDGFICPYCGGTHFRKETDTMDGWFDSGVTHAAVLEQDENLHWPADLYLEGNDQYRGWFQSSLLTSVATKGVAPYKAVCTHGWVVDGEGRKMSKSLGNGIAPEDVIKEYGADILRLWVASSDYHADIKISKDILKQLSEGYRKIRNTQRFILGNINDFNPKTNSVPVDQLEEMDQWALLQLNLLIDKVMDAYDRFDFHIVYHAIHNFCVVSMSNFYLDVLKDRLYVEKADSPTRRAAQTTIYTILSALTRILAPILSFTADEVWHYLPENGEEAVFLSDMPEKTLLYLTDGFEEKWARLIALREDVKKALEIARNEKRIGASLEAKVKLYVSEKEYALFSQIKKDMPSVFIVSQVEVQEGGRGRFSFDYAGISIDVEKADGEKCLRCWVYSDTVGKDSEHPALCARCASIVRE